MAINFANEPQHEEGNGPELGGTPAVSQDAVKTTAEVFLDGSGIELLAEDNLLLWTNGRQSIARQIEHYGQVYTAAELHPSLQRELRLVRACCDDWPINGSAINRLSSYFEKARIEADSSLLLAAAIPATWLAGCWLHRLPLVNLWGPPECAAPRPPRVDESRAMQSVELTRSELAGACTTRLEKNLGQTRVRLPDNYGGPESLGK